MISEPYQFVGTIARLRPHLGRSSAVSHRDAYLDFAEHIVRAFAPCQNADGVLIDPYHSRERNLEFFATTRFAGALGQLIKAGRCLDLRDVLVRAVECSLPLLQESALAPEFWAKELLYAWEALADDLPDARKRRWRQAWLDHDPRRSYRCIVEGMHHNLTTFALLAEFIKRKHGLSRDSSLVEEIIADQLDRKLFASNGLYVDPGAPMTYALVVNQQWDLMLWLGYQGERLAEVEEVQRRAGMTWLLIQSVTGEAPFGGRSNQFNFIEGHLACLYEARARHCAKTGDLALAGAFKRAAQMALESIGPWIMGMEPFRHLKHGFHPSLGHGVDSGGTYTVYGALAASLLATAYHLADDTIPAGSCPAEIGGYVVDLGPEFHKVFATCGGYHIEIETRAGRPRKDSTGLGRLHKRGVRPETAISSSIVSEADYSIGQGIDPPGRSLAFGPAWLSSDGAEVRLADMGASVEDVTLAVREQSADGVAFDVVYAGRFGGPATVSESYRLSEDGLDYGVHLDGTEQPSILVPLLVTDGDARSSISGVGSGFELDYRGSRYRAVADDGAACEVLCEAPLANRNGLYATGVAHARNMRATLD